jgi:hypothetical protein
MDTSLLWHNPLSHFNKKVRWTLDCKRIAPPLGSRRQLPDTRLSRDGARAATGRASLGVHLPASMAPRRG